MRVATSKQPLMYDKTGTTDLIYIRSYDGLGNVNSHIVSSGYFTLSVSSNVDVRTAFGADNSTKYDLGGGNLTSASVYEIILDWKIYKL